MEIVGTPANDILLGTPGDDYMFGLEGDDTLDGQDGTDYLEGGDGADRLIGGAGYDFVSYVHAPDGVVADLQFETRNSGRNAAGDTFNGIEGLIGSAFGDSLRGDGGDNYLFGLDGNDSLYGRDGIDTLVGGNGDDYLTGGTGGDYLLGGSGYDHVLYSVATAGVVADLANPTLNTGEAAGDRYESIEALAGSAFDDTLRGDSGDNLLWGGDGSDSLYGRDGNDTLIGGAGDDYLTGGEGADTLLGGAGFDTALYTFATAGLTVDLSYQSLNTGEAVGDNYNSIEGVAGSAFDDILAGSAETNYLWGGDGSDRLFGREGNDVLVGGAGDDFLEGGSGADVLVGGEGFDFATYTTANSGVRLLLSLQSASFGRGDAAGDSYFGIEGVIGSSFDDDLTGNDAGNIFRGGAGNDSLSGRGGADILDGGTGNDSLFGGAGRDTFIFGVGYGNDSISDMSSDLGYGATPLDVIQLSTALGVSSFADVLAHAQQVGNNTVITFDASTSLTLAGTPLLSLEAANFIFV